MRRSLILLPGLLLLSLCTNLFADLIGERANYKLDSSSDRSSWLIKRGEAKAAVTEYRVDEKFGPGYVITINYDLDIRFYGKQTGTIALLVPELVFGDQFYPDLIATHPIKMGGFDIDYEGMSSATDSASNSYDQCFMTRIFNIDPKYYPKDMTSGAVLVLWQKHQGLLSDIEELEIKLKVHPSVPVLGAVQIDISGMSTGIDFSAGLDLVPEMPNPSVN